MIALYIYRIEKEKEAEYLKVTKEVIKPFWEKRGCKYEVFKCEQSNDFIKIMTFNDENSLNSALFQKDHDTENIVNIFKDFAKDLRRYISKKVL